MQWGRPSNHLLDRTFGMLIYWKNSIYHQVSDKVHFCYVFLPIKIDIFYVSNYTLMIAFWIIYYIPILLFLQYKKYKLSNKTGDMFIFLRKNIGSITWLQVTTIINLWNFSTQHIYYSIFIPKYDAKMENFNETCPATWLL